MPGGGRTSVVGTESRCARCACCSRCACCARCQVEEMFQVGDLVDVAGTTIGKGFQGECAAGG